MAGARQFERLEMDSVVSTSMLDQTFLDVQGVGDNPDPFSARVGLMSLRGAFTVESFNRLINSISADIEEHEIVILDFSETVCIDDSAALVVEQIIDLARDENVECILLGLYGEPESTLRALSVLGRVPDHRFVANMDEAKEVAKGILGVNGAKDA